MDLRFPFSNRITYGKDNTEGVVDVLETYCYLKGLAIQRRLRFDLEGRVYRVVRSGGWAVVFREIPEKTDDTLQVLKILGDPRLAGITQLDINADVNKVELLDRCKLRDIHIITTEDFDSGRVWDSVESD